MSRGTDLRTQLHAPANELADFVRKLALRKAMKTWSLTSLSERLIKTAAPCAARPRRAVPDGRGGAAARGVRGRARRDQGPARPACRGRRRMSGEGRARRDPTRSTGRDPTRSTGKVARHTGCAAPCDPRPARAALMAGYRSLCRALEAPIRTRAPSPLRRTSSNRTKDDSRVTRAKRDLP